MSQTRVWTLLIRSVKVCSPPHCSNRWGTRDSGRDTQGLKSHTKCQGQKPRLFAGSHETHDGLRPPPRSGGITKQTWAGWRATGTCTHGEGARGQTYALLHAVIRTVCDLGDEGQRTCGEKQSTGPPGQGRASCHLLASCSGSPPAGPCMGVAPILPTAGEGSGPTPAWPLLPECL